MSRSGSGRGSLKTLQEGALNEGGSGGGGGSREYEYEGRRRREE